MTVRKPVAPFYAAAAVWLAYAMVFPLYRPAHYVLVTAASAAVFAVVSLLCRESDTVETTAEKATEKTQEEKSTGNEEVDKMLKNGRLAIAEMKRLNDSIADPGISADIDRLEQVSQKIFDEVKRDPKKLPQIQKFLDYYLPTTLKLLNAYDRASSAGISGENVDTTKQRVEGMMKTIVSAFEKQLDGLYGAETLDISTDITVLENMMAREGLAGDQLKADATQTDAADIKLEL
jgi:hypothetical protein